MTFLLKYLHGTDVVHESVNGICPVCRFLAAPKRSHAVAVKTILRYLKKTLDKGMTIHPTLNLFYLDLYVDADFCGLFGQEAPENPDSVKSRTGYIAILGGWPIIWKSQLQSCVTQSTMEAEYVDL